MSLKATFFYWVLEDAKYSLTKASSASFVAVILAYCPLQIGLANDPVCTELKR